VGFFIGENSEKNGLQEMVHLRIEVGKENSGQDITGAETGDEQGFGYGLRAVQNSR